MGNTYIEDEAISNVQLNEDADNDQNLYRKRLFNQISFAIPNLLFFASQLFLVSCFVNNYNSDIRSIEIHQNNINISSAVSELSIQAQMIWGGLNMFPYNVELLDIYEDRMYTADLILQVEINRGL